MRTAEEYVSEVVASMPASTPERAQIATELRGHIAERVGSGESLDQVLQRLGSPATLAESYLAAVPLESASIARRAAAKVLDVVVVLALMLPIAWLATRAVEGDAWLPMLLIVTLLGGSIIFALYMITAEYVTGSTVGKRALGLRVVRESGARISLGQAIVRQLPMFLQIYLIDAIFALFTERRQRAFELLSKTRVVSVSETTAAAVSRAEPA